MKINVKPLFTQLTMPRSDEVSEACIIITTITVGIYSTMRILRYVPCQVELLSMLCSNLCCCGCVKFTLS